jgi:hypothetical protein
MAGVNMLEAPAWSKTQEEAVRSLVEAEVAAVLPEFPTLASYHSTCLLSFRFLVVENQTGNRGGRPIFALSCWESCDLFVWRKNHGDF